MASSFFIIVDIQGFYGHDGQFLPKELAICDNERRVSHFIFEPPHHISSLPAKQRRTVNWLTKNHHCLEWDSGYVPIHRIEYILRIFGRHASTIYVRGEQKAEYLSKLLDRPIQDINKDDVKLSKSVPTCSFHKNNVCMCALSNVYDLYDFINGRREQEQGEAFWI